MHRISFDIHLMKCSEEKNQTSKKVKRACVLLESTKIWFPFHAILRKLYQNTRTDTTITEPSNYTTNDDKNRHYRKGT